MPPAVQNILQTTLPLPIVAFILLQAIALSWWASGEFRNLDGRIVSLEKTETDTSDQEARIIVLEQGITSVKDSLSEIKTLLRSPRPNQPL